MGIEMSEDVENCTDCASGMGCYHHSSKWMSEKIKDLQSRLNIAVECLKFYSEAFKKQPTSSMMGEYTPFLIDSGKRAREVLKQINPKGG